MKIERWLSIQGRNRFVTGDEPPSECVSELAELLKTYWDSKGEPSVGSPITTVEANAALEWRESNPPPSKDLQEVRVLRVQPGDVVVFKNSGKLSMYDAHELHKRMKAFFPGNDILIVDSGGTVEVVRKDE